MTSFSVYLHSLTHSVMLQRGEKKDFLRCGCQHFSHQTPRTLWCRNLILNICLWMLVKLYRACLPSHNKYWLIYKGMLGLSYIRQLYSIEVARGEAARKNTFLQREQFICAPLGGRGKGCWGGQFYCPPTDPGTYSWKLNKRKRIHFGVWDPPPGSLAN